MNTSNTNLRNENIAENRYRFRLSYDNLSRKEQQRLRKAMLEAFGWKTVRSFYQKLNGYTELTAIEKDRIDVILKKYGLKWDYEHETNTNQSGVPSR